MAGLIVRNPRGIIAGVPIISFGPAGQPVTHEWFEGDKFTRPKGLSQRDVDRWLADGYLEAAK